MKKEKCLGRRLEELRKRRSMNMKTLAEKSNISSSMLSQIEGGIANPSINTLSKLAEVLDVPLFYFFVESNPLDKLIVRSEDRLNISSPNSPEVVYELLSPNLCGSIELRKLTLPANTRVICNHMSCSGEEIAYVENGTVILNLDGDFVQLSSGDSAFLPKGMEHTWTNNSEESASLLLTSNRY